jgi:tRNA threonylcarbamoyladenosine biosynthesis protein TsaB
MTAFKLLAIETSSSTASIALALGDSLREESIATPREQTGRALDIVDDLLRAAGIGLGDLDAIVFGQGPGSFTGLRVAAAISQGLAMGAGTPIVPVSSLAALAQRAFDEGASAGDDERAAASDGERAVGGHGERVRAGAGKRGAAVGRALCCVDARMGEVYWATYSFANGVPVQLSPESIGAPATVQAPAAPYFIVGDGLLAFGEVLEPVISAASATDPALHPRARDLLPLAVGRVARGEFVPIESALPLYLREAGAWRTSS